MKGLSGLLLCAIASTLALYSCDTDDLRGCLCDYSIDLDNMLGFEVKDQAGDYVYGSNGLRILEEIPSGNDEQ